MVNNFLFHRVNPVRDSFWDPMDVSLFEKCIEFISKKYRVELIENIAFSPDSFSENNIATIMFDDGYKDNIEFAAPILKKYNCKASFYVVTECIENNIPTWTKRLEHIIQETHKSKIILDFNCLPQKIRQRNLDTNEKKKAYIFQLKSTLKKLSHEERSDVLNYIYKEYFETDPPKIMMSWKDLFELKNEGHYIGSHSVSHNMLGTMTNEDEIRGELKNSAGIIQLKLGHFPVTISYPVGSYNKRVIELSKEVGYQIGLVVKQSTYDPKKDDVFEIPRIELYNESWFKTRLRITNTLEKIKRVIHYK
ncbi:MAG: hypothetical protein CVU05_07690 [Bacteroidetes bacterium HGW-Bacteroidetes-21]|jgi:peptidoglycan/xylan/chitin deacetylase (PgdA/CDA1 family)|nr:MAG: hypothetical protein CVU05_07690 [Bacteroidetes bacterium HGW-Bacteroidetes-21]